MKPPNHVFNLYSLLKTNGFNKPVENLVEQVKIMHQEVGEN
jgi:hypothetical protein